MHITIPSSTNDDRNPHWYLLYTYRSAVLVVLVLHIYSEWLQTQSLLISFFHLDSFSPLDLNLRSSSNDVHRDPLGLSLLRKEALYPPRALFAQIGTGAVTIPVVSKDPIPMEWWSFFQGKRSVSDRFLVFCKRRSLPIYSMTMRLTSIRVATYKIMSR